MSYIPSNWCIAKYGCRELAVSRIRSRPVSVSVSSIGSDVMKLVKIRIRIECK